MKSLSQPNFHLIALAGGAKSLAVDDAKATEQELGDKAHLLYCLEQASAHGNVAVSCIDFRFWQKLLASSELCEEMEKEGAIMLTTHHDCGAYGGFDKFGNDREREEGFLKTELAKASKVVCSDAACKSLLGNMIVSEICNAFPGEHICDAVVLSCCESPYWQRAFERTGTETGLRCFDILTSFGGAKMIARPPDPAYADHLLRNLEISKKLHEDPRGIVLAGHSGGSCGMTREDLDDAAGIIRERLGDVSIEMLWID